MTKMTKLIFAALLLVVSNSLDGEDVSKANMGAAEVPILWNSTSIPAGWLHKGVIRLRERTTAVGSVCRRPILTTNA